MDLSVQVSYHHHHQYHRHLNHLIVHMVLLLLHHQDYLEVEKLEVYYLHQLPQQNLDYRLFHLRLRQIHQQYLLNYSYHQRHHRHQRHRRSS